MITGKVTIEVDLKDFGSDLDYPFEELLQEEVANYIRNYIRDYIGKEHKKIFQKWTVDYLAGKHPVDPDGCVMLAIPVDLFK